MRSRRYHSTVHDEPDGLRITIPANRYWFVVSIHGLWVIGMSVGIFKALSVLVKLGSPSEARLVISILFPLILAWLYGLYFWLWNIGGKEMVSLKRQIFSVRREILGLGFTWEFDSAKVRNLRSSAGEFSLVAWAWGMGERILFDYGSKTYRFGKGLHELQVQHLIGAIMNRHKQ